MNNDCRLKGDFSGYGVCMCVTLFEVFERLFSMDLLCGVVTGSSFGYEIEMFI